MSFVQSQVTCDHRVGSPLQTFSIGSCPRCLGKGWYGGYFFNNLGKIALKTDVDALNQAITKILISKRDSNGYGFDYNAMVLNYGPTRAQAFVSSEVTRCINYLMNIQATETKRNFIYSPSEKIAQLLSVTVEPNPYDPRSYNAYVSVQTVSNQVVTSTTTLRV